MVEEPPANYESTTLPTLAPGSITLTLDDLLSISSILHMQIRDRDSLLRAATMLVTASVDGVDIDIEPRLLQRIKSRCPGGVPFPRFLQDTITQQLHAFVGW